MITQPWRELGAILWFHFIIHIFITIYHKLIKFHTHKLQVMCQHINTATPPCASRRARQNLKMLKITFWTMESTFQVILSISKFSVRTCPSAQRAEKVEIQNFYMIWIPDTIIIHFYSFSVTVDLSWGRARASKLKIRACCYGQYNVNLFKYMPVLNPLQLLRMRGYPQILFNTLKAIEWEI